MVDLCNYLLDSQLVFLGNYLPLIKTNNRAEVQKGKERIVSIVGR